MKVALVVCAIQMGGMDTMLRRLYGCFRQAGHGVAYVETDFRGGWADEYEESGVNVIDVLPRLCRSRVHHAKAIFCVLKEFDVILLNDTPYAQSALGLLPEGTVSIAILHLPLMSMIQNASGNRFECDSVVAVSPGVKEAFVRAVDVRHESVFCIANGVEVPESWPRGDDPLCPDAPLRAAYVGRVEDRQKGVLLLPGILGKAKMYYPNITLDIIGDGPDVGRVKAEFARAGLHTAVRFHGVLDHTRTLGVLRNEDILLMPSRFEGHPMVLLEALAYGVVPLVTSLPGFTDNVVENCRTGFLVGVDDVDGFARALADAGRDRVRLRRMAEAGWATARRRFRVEVMAESYLQLIRRLREARMAGRARPRSMTIDKPLLGELPKLPVCLVRPWRKILRTLGLWPRAHLVSG